MSILNNPQVPEVDPAVRVANQIKQQARSTFQNLVQVFNQGAQSFWSNPRATPAQIAAALGTDATEVFQLHGKIGALLAEIKPEAIQPGLSLVGQYSYNQDGSVTITPPAEPQ